MGLNPGKVKDFPDQIFFDIGVIVYLSIENYDSVKEQLSNPYWSILS